MDNVKELPEHAAHALGHKAGPLPVWGWAVAVVVVGGGAMMIFSGRGDGVSSSPLAGTPLPQLPVGAGGGGGSSGSAGATPTPAAPQLPVAIGGTAVAPPGWTFQPSAPTNNGPSAPSPVAPIILKPGETYVPPTGAPVNNPLPSPAAPPIEPKAKPRTEVGIGAIQNLIDLAEQTYKNNGSSWEYVNRPDVSSTLWRTALPGLTSAQIDGAIQRVKDITRQTGAALTPGQMREVVDAAVNRE